jgi:hypothetical protein
MLERPTVIPGPLDGAVELGDNPPSIPLDPKRSETRFPSELVLVGVADAEPLVTVAVVEAAFATVGCTTLVGRPVVEPTAEVVLGSNNLPRSLPKPPNKSGDDEVVESVAAASAAVTAPAATEVGLAVVTGSGIVFV